MVECYFACENARAQGISPHPNSMIPSLSPVLANAGRQSSRPNHVPASTTSLK